jgi:glycosyltransferase involved in cell wall biosynthesis
MGKRVSVVIPVHNYARFVSRAIDSVLAQTYGPIECIVVDDGSTDDTPRVLTGYGDRIRVIRKDKQGPAIARNTGIRAATGEYIALLDSDDAWRPAKLARQVPILDEAPSLGAVGCANELVDGAGAHLGNVVFRSPVGLDARQRIRAVALRQLWVGGSCTGALIPRRVLDDVGPFDETLTAAEDWDMWLRLVAKYPVRNLSEVLIAISQHGTGFARNAEKVAANQWKVYEAAVARWPDVFDVRLRRQVRALILADAGGEYMGGKELRLALRRYAASLREWPFDARRWRVTAGLLLQRVRA